MSMKANELTSKDLMVGDWLMFNDKPCQVKGLLGDDSAFFVGYKSPYYLIDAEPIPITTEILEKNGFENQWFRYHDEYNGINDRVVLKNKREYINSDNEWRVLIESEDYHSIAHCELTYVHELQHILRLCKIDKEIII